MTYAHHGQIRCHKINHPNPWFWHAECDCGWELGASAFSWAGAYWALVRHQTDLEPKWVVYPRLVHPRFDTRPFTTPNDQRPNTDDLLGAWSDAINETPLQRAHNTTARRNQ